MFIKINMWSVNFFSRVLLDPVIATGHVMNDQATISRLLHDDPDGVALHYWDIPPTWLNNYSPEQNWDTAVQAHLVNHLKKEKSHIPYIHKAANIYEKANNDVKLLLKSPDIQRARHDSRIFWQDAKPGIKSVKFLLEG